jgi:uncharacterized protein YjbI with pentapeptide repeats
VDFANERLSMDTEQIKLDRMKQRVEATDTDMSGSTFTDVNLSGAKLNDVNLTGAIIDDANLSGLRISNANLTGVSIVESLTEGMTIDGIAVSDLMATYRAAHPKPK